MDKQFHPTLFNGCGYLSTRELKLIHVSKREHLQLVYRARQVKHPLARQGGKATNSYWIGVWVNATVSVFNLCACNETV